jgi:serine/threonine protein kinase
MAVSFPRQFGKYVLLKPLAKGGMGEIYLAALGQLDGFDKLCVIKKVIPEKSDAGKAKRFLDEAKVVLRLTHSGLVNTFDAGQVEREFYIAMEMVEGKDLREVWNRCVRVRHRIPIEVALHVAREVARTLSYVHDYGNLNLVHRDVAPPNIMLAYNGDVKLTDFGLARSALKQEHTQPGVVFGRAAYLAPEQARGEVADPRADLYSLAVVLWELLTGHQYLQITGLDPAAALSLVRHPKPTPPSSRAPWVSPGLDQVLLRALSPDRSKRFANAEEFRLALSEAIADAAPRTDAARVFELMHAIYHKAIVEEAAERERFLKEVLPSFRASSTPPMVAVPPPVPAKPPELPRMAKSPSGKVKSEPPSQPNRTSEGVVAEGDEREARKQAKREAALKVLAELATADGSAQTGK